MVVAGDYSGSVQCWGDPGVSTTPGIPEGIRGDPQSLGFLIPRHETFNSSDARDKSLIDCSVALPGVRELFFVADQWKRQAQLFHETRPLTGSPIPDILYP